MFHNILAKAAAGLMAINVASAHIELSWPYPLRSKFDPNTPQDLIDYDMIEPLYANGSDFPCKGYHTNTPRRVTAAWTAGQQNHISLMPPVTTKGIGAWNHGGGSCQLSLSYNNGTSFHVIQSVHGGCPLQYKYDFTVPKDVANGDALLGWSWFNLEGEPQMYMNCADITISGGSATAAAFEFAYPKIFVANVNNGCSTVELQEAIFPEPGKQVLYGGNATRFSAPIPKCA